MKWLPEMASFSDALKGAEKSATDPEALVSALRGIAGHRLDFVQTGRLAKRLSTVEISSLEAFRVCRIALAGGAEAQHLAAGIQVGMLRRNLVAEVRVGGFGQFRREILDASSWLGGFAPQFLLLAVPAGQLIEPVEPGTDIGVVRARDRATLDGVVELWRQAKSRYGVTVLQQTLLDTGEPNYGHYDRQDAAEFSARVAWFNAELIEAASNEGARIFDLDTLVKRAGRDAWYDDALWHKAKIEIKHEAAPLYGDHVARIVGAALGKSRKCLILDLDNTLWGGVIGDDGPGKIKLGQGDPVGEAFQAFQAYCKRLADRGVILAVCSKNERAIAEQPFRELPDMVLKLDDFAAFVANWQDKASNLRAIAATLNIGLDSLVFFDDNPAERLLVRRELPMIAVPEVPDDPARFAACLASAGYFESVALTTDDLKRKRQYAENRERETAASGATNMDAYLSDLAMTLTVGPFGAANISRVAQLINKTNQFNLTTKRKTEAEIAALLVDPAVLTFQGRLVDRFGDNGLICVAILTPAKEGEASCDIETWLMSCRVFGRRVEHEFFDAMVEGARGAGLRTFYGSHVPTAKNDIVGGLYADLGFEKIADDPRAGTRWRLELERHVRPKTGIARKTE